MGGIKKHKKHKREKYEGQYPADKPPALKLILKVGSSSTPEHNSNEWPGPAQGSAPLYSVQGQDEESRQSAASGSFCMGPPFSHHKKSKKKKKKKDKGKDRERKHRHHHKEKKRKREESSQDEVSFGEDSLAEPTGSPGTREPRLCVLRQRQERTPLQKMLEHLLKALEKRDPQQFFAWPVTDNIAPGYSHIISKPMDFSTMKQKIDDCQYNTLHDFIADFRLMCTNAMEYNHADTVYYKASKKLLHAGMKIMQPDKLGIWLLTHIPDLTSEELGFEIPQETKSEVNMEIDDTSEPANNNTQPLTKFEAIPDDLSPEEILAKCQVAAKGAKAKLSLKYVEPKMGFLRQKKDGTTTLNVLVGGDGVIPGTNERPVSLGVLTGKLTEGTGQIQGFREDRRNVIKPVKPLYYGAFGSYAPSYDSTFANLSKEESDLVYQTYGSDTAVQYAESILDFAKDCDYTLKLVDNLLDLLTGGDHSKTKKVLEEKKKLKEEEETIRTLLEDKVTEAPNKIDFDNLKSLSDVGIDMAFLSNFQSAFKKEEEHQHFQNRLQTTSQLLEKLHQVQNERLSLPLPPHLGSLPSATDQELALADNITANLTDMAKKVMPGEVVSVAGLRKAMGIGLVVDGVDVETLAEGHAVEGPAPEMPDLESELRQFLESEPALSQSPLRVDKTIEEILME